MMKKLIIILLCLCLVGCKNNNNVRVVNMMEYNKPEEYRRKQNITIYNYNEISTKLESSIVSVGIQKDHSRAQEALYYLLSGADFSFSQNNFGIPDYTYYESNGIAVVNIKNEYKLEDELKQFALHFSIVNTLSSIEGINYVCVYAGNKELAGDFNIGASKFIDTNISDYYLEIVSKANDPSTYQRQLLLFYPDKNSEYIVPEVHQMYINQLDIKETIVSIMQKLAMQPTNSTDLSGITTSEVEIKSVSIEEDELSINLNKSISENDISYIALLHSINFVFPNVKQININLENSKEYNIANSMNLIADVFTIVLPSQQFDALYPVNIFIPAQKSLTVSDILEKVCNTSINGFSSPLPSGVGYQNIINTKIINDIAIIDFDPSFIEAIKDLDANRERSMVYSIVNSLVNHEQINSVQFLVNSQCFDTVTTNINYSKPFLKNPGMILK